MILCKYRHLGVDMKLSPIVSRPARIHAALTDHASGRRYASVTKIEEAGHLVRAITLTFLLSRFSHDVRQIPQEVPDQLGDVLHDILAMESRRPAKAKL